MTERNPITERLELLYAQWTDFSLAPDARVLRWLLRDDEVRMIETFVGVEHTEAGRLPVLFSRLSVPFERSQTYAFALRDRLLDEIEREAEEEEALRGFAPPPPRADDEGLVGLLQLAEALIKHVRERRIELQHLALTLLPPPIENIADWTRFVAKLALRLAKSEVRAIVLDRAQAPVLDPAVELAPAEIWSVAANLDMPGAVREVSARAGKLDEPPGKFRHAYTLMLESIAKQDMAEAQQHAATASTVASTQGWWHLLVGVAFCLGTGHLDAQRPGEAAQWFRRAEEPLNARAKDLGVDEEPKLVESLRLKCRLGLGAACYFAGAFDRAAEAYGSAADIAHVLEDRLAELDARRMQSHCCERAGKLEDAWTRGLEGVGIASEIPANDRKMSTLPHLGRAMLQLTNRSSMRHRRPAIASRLDALLGAGWESA